MKKMLTTTALMLALALSAGASAASAKPKGKKQTPEHAAAVKKCDADYKAALKDARTKKGAERKSAEQAARAARKRCMADAPM